MINKFIGNGRVTKDIELKCTPNGTSAVSFTLAIPRPFKNQNGEYESDFIQCTAFKGTAELLSKYVKKGDTLGVEGSVRTRSYVNKDNNTVYVTEIVVDSIDFLKQASRKEEQVNKLVIEEPKQTDDTIIYPEDITFTDEDLPY